MTENCHCKPDWDVRCKCESRCPMKNTLEQFNKCPERVSTMVFMIGNNEEEFNLAMSGDFNFLFRVYEMNIKDVKEVITLFMEDNYIDD